MTGMGDWTTCRTFDVSPDNPVSYEFPAAFQAYWVRTRSDIDTRATAQLRYQ